jgi:hypothetical protein
MMKVRRNKRQNQKGNLENQKKILERKIGPKKAMMSVKTRLFLCEISVSILTNRT